MLAVNLQLTVVLPTCRLLRGVLWQLRAGAQPAPSFPPALKCALGLRLLGQICVSTLLLLPERLALIQDPSLADSATLTWAIAKCSK